MNAVRRTAMLIGLTTAVVTASSIPASATFADTVTIKPSIRAVDVLAPTRLTATITCTTYSRDARITWTASPTADIDRYVIDAVVGGQPMQFSVPGNATELQYSIPASILPYPVPARATVTTATTYGWAETSGSVTAVWKSC